MKSIDVSSAVGVHQPICRALRMLCVCCAVVSVTNTSRYCICLNTGSKGSSPAVACVGLSLSGKAVEQMQQTALHSSGSGLGLPAGGALAARISRRHCSQLALLLLLLLRMGLSIAGAVLKKVAGDEVLNVLAWRRCAAAA